MTTTSPLRIAVLASGRGSNLQALLQACASGRLNARVVLVGSDRRQAQALHRAEMAGIAHFSLDPKAWPDRASFDAALFGRVAQSRPDLVVLAGYMRILDAGAVEAWQGRMINIHPSLLPRHRGLHTIARLWNRAMPTTAPVCITSVPSLTAAPSLPRRRPRSVPTTTKLA